MRIKSLARSEWIGGLLWQFEPDTQNTVLKAGGGDFERTDLSSRVHMVTIARASIIFAYTDNPDPSIGFNFKRIRVVQLFCF